MLDILIDTIFVQFGKLVRQQTLDISMNTFVFHYWLVFFYMLRMQISVNGY